MTRRAVLAAAVTAVLVCGTVGCGSDTGTAPPPPTVSTTAPGGGDAHTTLPDPLAEVTLDPGRTAETALAVMFSWQPGTDPGPAAAVGRAVPYLAGELAAAATRTLAQPLLPEQWPAWARSHDVVTAAAIVRDGDPRTHTTTAAATRVLDLRRTVLHRDGQTTPLPALAAVVELTHTAAGWRVSGYHLTGD